MLDVMFDIPSNPEIKEVIVTPETVNDGTRPVTVVEKEKEAVAS